MSKHEGLPERAVTGAERRVRRGTSRVFRRYLLVTHADRIEVRQASLCGVKLLEVLDSVWDPRCSVQFVTGVEKAGTFYCGYVVSGMSATSVKRLTVALSHTLGATMPWLGLAQPATRRPWSQSRARVNAFGPTAHATGATSARSLVWSEAMRAGGAWQLTLDIDLPQVRFDPPQSELDDSHSVPGWVHGGSSPGVKFDEAGARSNGRGVLCSMTLTGSGPAASGGAIAALIAADSTGPQGLSILRPDSPQARRPFGFAVELVSHVLATPTRVGSLLPERPCVPTSVLFDRIDAAPVPHVLACGASGQGKTTILGHIGDRTLKTEPIIVIDIHDGDLTDRLAEAADRRGARYLYARFGSPRVPGDAPAGFRFLDPPPGVDPEQHIDGLQSTNRDVAFVEGIPFDHMGTVGTKINRVNWSLCVYDPARSYLPGDICQLVDPSEPAFRQGLLHRIGSEDLTRSVDREVMPMVEARDAGNASAWITSKFDPYDSRIFRALAASEHNRLPVDEAIDRGYSLLIHAPAAELGEQGARLLVAMILQRAYNAIIRVRPDHRYTFILDEWQKYSSALTTTMLTEGRKFGVRVVAANQNLTQLGDELRDAIVGNTGAILCYRLGPSDARFLDGVFPKISTFTMQTLPRHTLAVSLFDEDFIVATDAPLPAGRIPLWSAQIKAFWAGQEPAVPAAPPIRGRERTDPETAQPRSATTSRPAAKPRPMRKRDTDNPLPFADWMEARQQP